VFVYKSRYTPGLINGKDVNFQKGEKVRYKMRSGEELDIIIDSERMHHTQSGLYGYESIFLDDNKKYFAASTGIINWEGKC
jgi:hypothetical protein